MIRFFLNECFIGMLLVLVIPVFAERAEHDGYNERTSYLISKIQIMTDADRIEALKHACDEEIKQFCLENNYN